MAGRPKRGSVVPKFVPASNATAPPAAPEPERKIIGKVEPEVKLQNVQNITPVVPKPPVITPMETTNGAENTEDSENEKKSSLFRKFFGGVRKKTTARERKMRQNKRLRKILIPKNALMALHEIKGIQMSDFVITPRNGGGFTAEVTVNNIQYDGYGPSKLSAKNSVCEKALRDLIISKMMQNPSKHNSTEQLDTIGNNTMEQDDGEDVQMKDMDDDESDLPMINLASFALYKLFSEWENEGFEVPEFRTHSTPNNGAQPGETTKKAPTTRSELPPDWESMHPTTLLCMMRPGISYTDLGSEGSPPNHTQKIGVTVDGEHFIGVGRSKKLARRDAACIACNKLFNTNFQKM